MDLSNMIINPPLPPDEQIINPPPPPDKERIKPQVSNLYRNPPAPPDQEKIKPIIVEKESDELDFAAILKELCEQGIFDCEEEYRFSDLTSSSSGEEGEIKDSSPDDTMYEVVVKKEPVDKSEINQEKDLGKRLMLMDIKGGKKESTTQDRKSNKKKRSKHKKKHSRRDDYDSDESDYSRRYSKSKRVQESVRKDSRSDDSDGSVEFICSRRKEDKIIFENLTSSSDESQSKEKEHNKKQKQAEQEHFSDKDRHSRPVPVPPSNSKEDKIKETRKETSKKNERSTEEKSKEERLREERLREERLREERLREERLREEKLREKKLKEEKLKEEKLREKKLKEEKLKEEKLREKKVKEEKLKEEKIKEEKSKDEKEEYIKEEKKFKFKEEKGFFKEEYGSVQHIHGSYFCETCHVTMNSEQAFNNHMHGKKHLKALKLRNAPLVVASTITPSATEGNSKYPIAHPGVTREKVNEEASVQIVLERINNRKMPFPGLECVTEIHLLTEKKYYCEICDAVCSPDTIVPHLQGYKHRLKLLKKYRPELAERWAYKAKNEIDDEVCNILYAIQRKRGLGKMAVEKDRPNSSADCRYYDNQPSTSYGMPSTSRAPALKFEDYYEMASQPDPTKPGFYCRTCFSHMNSSAMWESHIRGKRHLTNLKKHPGDLPSKAKTLPAANVPSRLLVLIDDIEEDIHHQEDYEPIVGLENIQETQTRETNSEMYQCFLCGACSTPLDIYDHLISYKHRLKYLEHIDSPDKELLVGMGDSMARTIMKQICISIEEEKGRGSPIVCVSKGAMSR